MAIPRLTGVLSVIAWLVAPSLSHSDDWNSTEVDTCISTDTSIALDRKISACDSVIVAHTTPSAQLAIIYNSRGWWQFSKKAYDLALESFNTAINIDRSYAFAYNNRGLVYHHLGRFQEAIADFERANRRNETAEHYLNLAIASAHLGDKPAVETNIDKAEQMAPGSAKVGYAACMSAAILGEPGGPVAACDKVIALTPNDPFAYEARGYANQQAGNYLAAIRDYRHALTLNPQLDTSLFSRGVAYLSVGDRVAARLDIEKARQLNPSIDSEMALDKIKVPAGF